MGEHTPAPGTSGDLVVAVDCSTTASKAVVFDAQGQALSSGRSAIRTMQPGPGRHEQDPENWWSATCEALRAALATVDAGRVAAVCVTTQRETFVSLDRNGRAVYPGIVWMDTRARDLVAELGCEHVHAVSGRPPDNTPSIYKLAWLIRNERDAMAHARHIGDVSAFLNMRLCGRWISSQASADSMGLFDMAELEWSPELLALTGVDERVLPTVVAPGTVVGAITAAAARETGLAAGTPLVAGAGDGQCAAVGAGVHEAGALYLNMGTAVVCGRASESYSWDRAYRTVAGANGSGYLLEAFTSSGTYLVNWFREEFGGTEEGGADAERIAAELPPGSEGLLALPYWNAAQTPYWDSRARGALVGLTGRHGRGHIYRAILEGIAFEIKLEVAGLEAVGAPLRQVYVTGGGSRSSLWVQMVADILQRPLTLCSEQETTALGAAMIGVVAAGLQPSMEAAAKAMVRYGSTVAPNAETGARYDTFWPVYRGLYQSLRPALHALSDLT
ncbi:hypothetical protein JDV09_03270 [Mycobacterium sp. Y57]|uniref:xylulokinase n=1 Tax=Mycolicibacterium xanthum TaxID=2796469 RepID=UPI001C861B5B|nr:FGGY family carbohydrate kinase [Mycolicibacterium xanthum]MBX7431135.1 hypothetical protein [Mycolicibacterium xanthum]